MILLVFAASGAEIHWLRNDHLEAGFTWRDGMRLTLPREVEAVEDWLAGHPLARTDQGEWILSGLEGRLLLTVPGYFDRA